MPLSEYSGSRCVEIEVDLNGCKLNHAIDIDQKYFDSDTLPKSMPLTGQTGATINAPAIYTTKNVVTIKILLDAKTAADTYRAPIYDTRVAGKP